MNTYSNNVHPNFLAENAGVLTTETHGKLKPKHEPTIDGEILVKKVRLYVG